MEKFSKKKNLAIDSPKKYGLLDLDHYNYQLPDHRIARFPLKQRDESKLLIYRKGKIIHSQFKYITDFLSANSMLVFNNTCVVKARLIFHRLTGAKIEVFCLEPADLDKDITESLTTTGSVIWKCLVGNKDKWKNREELELLLPQDGQNGEQIFLKCKPLEDEDQYSKVEFNWPDNYTFEQILNIFGHTPIPPYLERADVAEDVETYQTVYADHKGAVAAPTAGFHFTPIVFDRLEKKQLKKEYITLHVGAGTFQPIKVADITKHKMHAEQVIFTKENLENLCSHHGSIVCVGTTSLRALESLYWYGVNCIKQKNDQLPFIIDQDLPNLLFESKLPGKAEVFSYLLDSMEKQKKNILIGETSIFIYPGYKFRVCNDLITNYHQPQSSLLLLLAAFMGDDWKKMYREAMSNGYRFLSYGDSTLIFGA
jgi:S-adenosylmethionine:tRNA ribosyltransferase-isomerase